MTRVTEIHCLEELAPYRLLWNALLPQTRGATFFQSFEWLETYWRHHGDRQRMRVLIVAADDRPIGILPLTVIRERTRLGTIRVLTYPLDGWGTFYGPIGPNPTATLWAGLRHLNATHARLGSCRLPLDRCRRDRRRPHAPSPPRRRPFRQAGAAGPSGPNRTSCDAEQFRAVQACARAPAALSPSGVAATSYPGRRIGPAAKPAGDRMWPAPSDVWPRPAK